MPEQPWLDGYCVAKVVIRQFVAIPLGAGYTVEEQLTGVAENGGLQIIAFPMKRERYEQLEQASCDYDLAPRAMATSDMGMAPAGRMKQEIYDDPYGLDAWDQSKEREPLIREHHQLPTVAGHHRRAPAHQSADGRAVRRGGAPLVRLLQRTGSGRSHRQVQGCRDRRRAWHSEGQTPLPENTQDRRRSAGQPDQSLLDRLQHSGVDARAGSHFGADKGLLVALSREGHGVVAGEVVVHLLNAANRFSRHRVAQTTTTYHRQVRALARTLHDARSHQNILPRSRHRTIDTLFSASMSPMPSYTYHSSADQISDTAQPLPSLA